MSKFKVGDKVKAIDNYYVWTTLKRGWTGEITSIKGDSFVAKTVSGHDSDTGAIYSGLEFEHFELIERTEFTFKEVIARIKEGEVYENIDDSFRTRRIIEKGGWISIEYEGNYKFLGTDGTYKLVSQKKTYTLYEVEHQEGGKRYLFRSLLKRNVGEMVVCDTKFGRSYGQVVEKKIKELTDKEYEEYKLIIKAV